MLPSDQSNLLRRTAGALVLASGFAFVATGALAQSSTTITFTGPTGTSCQYESMTVTPSGGINVVTTSCTGGNTTPTPTTDTYNLNLAATTADPGATVALSVTRAGPATASASVVISATGGCVTSGGSVAFGAGDTQPKGFTVSTPASGSCTIGITAPTGGVVGSISQTIISINGGSGSGGGGGDVPAGCPAVPAGTIRDKSFGEAYSNNFFMAASGTVLAIPLPNAQLLKSSAKLNMASSPSAYSPSSAVVDMSISRCPGVIDSNLTNGCNRQWTSAINSMIWFKKAYGTINSTATAGASYCWAPETEPQYLNIRYTYSPGTCGYGAAECGYNWQWLNAY